MRPRDEDGIALPMPHLRLPNVAQLQQAALFEMATDGRSCALTVKRKLTMIDKVIDHVVDGDAVPKWVHAPDPDVRENHFLVDMWRLAERAVRAAQKVSA